MSEDWATVAIAINERMTELGLTQRELVERSQVSKAMVTEIRHNVAQRRRSSRTLEALSLALGWHPQHLDAVLRQVRIPAAGEPIIRSEDDIVGRLAAIEYRLEQISAQLAELKQLGGQLDEISSQVDKIARHLRANEQDAAQ